MQRNSSHCGHCGNTFVRITEQTPLVNRSDGKRFHVTLFSGPDPRPRVLGGFHDNEVICQFLIANERFGPNDHTVVVVIARAEKAPKEVLGQIEDAADKLAELVATDGLRLDAVYAFNDRRLTPEVPIVHSGKDYETKRKLRLQRNSDKCGHCGKPFLRLTGGTPIVNRSFEKIFHLTLFSGPQPRPSLRGGFYQKQAICNFTYSHHQLEANADHVVNVVLLAQHTDRETARLVEEAIDQLADLVAEGKKLESVYTFDGDKLAPGFPK